MDRKSIVQRAKRVAVKIGSNVLTAETGLNTIAIRRICDDIAELIREGRQVIIVSSGAIASGFRKLGLPERPRTIQEKQATAAVGQSSLIQAYEESLAPYGITVAQVLLTADDLADRRRYLNANNTINTLLVWKVVPVINENDTVSVEELKFGDNDNLAALIALMVEADLLVNLTDIDGLFDCDPRENPTAQLIRVVDEIDAELEACALKSPGTLGIGGMASKVDAARKATEAGIPMIIAHGLKRHILEHIFKGLDIGTFFLPHERRLSAKKQWILNILKPQGDVVVDRGAAAALVGKGKSLLPSGITAVHGDFGTGEAVRVVDDDRGLVGVGLTNYTSREIEAIKGLRTSEVEERLGYKHSDEVIHRDNLVVTLKAG